MCFCSIQLSAVLGHENEKKRLRQYLTRYAVWQPFAGNHQHVACVVHDGIVVASHDRVVEERSRP